MEKVELLEIIIRALPSFPFLVVIKITPDAALEPYKAAAAGPLNTDILSISSGLISDIPSPLGWAEYCPLVSPLFVLKIGTPSITYKALLSEDIDLVPRIITRVAPPTPDEDALILTPATFPASEFIKLALFTVVNSSPFTSCTL